MSFNAISIDASCCCSLIAELADGTLREELCFTGVGVFDIPLSCSNSVFSSI